MWPGSGLTRLWGPRCRRAMIAVPLSSEATSARGALRKTLRKAGRAGKRLGPKDNADRKEKLRDLRAVESVRRPAAFLC